MIYQRTYSSLYAATLTPEQHERTCDYWFTVTNGATAHTAFATHDGLDRWLAERGLSLEKPLPPVGEAGWSPIRGEYRTAMHGEFLSGDYRDGMGPGEFYGLRPTAATADLSNGDWTLALITEEDGVRTVHTLNPNVRGRVVFDRERTSALMR